MSFLITPQANLALQILILMTLTRAYCTINLWSVQDWTGQIPEFTMPMLLLAFIMASFVVVFVHRRGKLTSTNR